MSGRSVSKPVPVTERKLISRGRGVGEQKTGMPNGASGWRLRGNLTVHWMCWDGRTMRQTPQCSEAETGGACWLPKPTVERGSSWWGGQGGHGDLSGETEVLPPLGHSGSRLLRFLCSLGPQAASHPTCCRKRHLELLSPFGSAVSWSSAGAQWPQGDREVTRQWVRHSWQLTMGHLRNPRDF